MVQVQLFYEDMRPISDQLTYETDEGRESKTIRVDLPFKLVKSLTKLNLLVRVSSLHNG